MFISIEIITIMGAIYTLVFFIVVGGLASIFTYFAENNRKKL